MNRQFEIQKVRNDIYRIYDKRLPTQQGLYFRKSEVSDIVHELMYYCDEAV